MKGTGKKEHVKEEMVYKYIVPEIYNTVSELQELLRHEELDKIAYQFKALRNLIKRNRAFNHTVFEPVTQVIDLCLNKGELLRRSALNFTASVESFAKNILNNIFEIIGVMIVEDDDLTRELYLKPLSVKLQIELSKEHNIDILNHSMWIVVALISRGFEYKIDQIEQNYIELLFLFLNRLKLLKTGNKEQMSDMTKIKLNYFYNEEPVIDDDKKNLEDNFMDNLTEIVNILKEVFEKSDTLSIKYFTDKNSLDTLIDLFFEYKDDLEIFNCFLSLFWVFSSTIKNVDIVNYFLFKREVLTVFLSKLHQDHLQVFIKGDILNLLSNFIHVSSGVKESVLNNEQFFKLCEDFIFHYKNEQLSNSVVWCLHGLTLCNNTVEYKALRQRKIDIFVLKVFEQLNGNCDAIITLLILDILQNLFERDSAVDGELLEYVKESEYIDLLFDLQMHKREKIYNKVFDIINRHFQDMI